MKEFFTKAFAAELKKQGYEISPRTLEGWRISRNGEPPKFPAGRYDGKGKVAVYFDTQFDAIKLLLKKKTSPSDVAISLFGGLAEDTADTQSEVPTEPVTASAPMDDHEPESATLPDQPQSEGAPDLETPKSEPPAKPIEQPAPMDDAPPAIVNHDTSISDKKISPANPADEKNTEQKTHNEDSTGGEIIQGAIVNNAPMHDTPKQILENLPQELLAQKRFFPVKIAKDGRKVPCIKEWENPNNQMTAAEAIKKTGLIGMDISGHGLNPDYFFVDFDHVLNGDNFIYPDAQKWYNYLSTAETFSERSISKGGCHFLLNPTPNIFPKLTGGNDCSIFFDDTKHGKNSPKIELFYLQNRWILLTADLLNCAPNTPIISGACADEFAQQLINHVAYDHSNIKDTDAKKITFTDSDINVEEVQKMLAVIPCAKTQYNDWWKVAAILHHHFGANGFDPWRAWSETDKARYTLETCQKVWSDLDKRSAANIGRPATIGSLIFFAKNFGYRDSSEDSASLRMGL